MINNIFEKYKNKHKGQTAALFGSGPSLNAYKPLDGIDINVGTNFIGNHHLFKGDAQLLDYYFFGDRGRCMDKSYKVNFAKFGASEVDGREHPLHYSYDEILAFGAEPMSVTNTYPQFHLDIAKNPTHGVSVIFHALNFLFYVGVKKIYIIGCDCSSRECFDGNDIINSGPTGTYDGCKVGWVNAKRFIKENKLECEIISVNPVGLKGFFKEIEIN
tara:strand:- start:4142 stop:4789 length:648 start_codon:yes stop_codon:yes gene_type:complete